MSLDHQPSQEELHLTEEIAELKARIAELELMRKHYCEDWAEDDTALRNTCRPILGKLADDDGYAVTPITDVVGDTVKKIQQRNEAMAKLLDELWWGNPYDIMAKHKALKLSWEEKP